jgi:hypothetical protein
MEKIMDKIYSNWLKKELNCVDATLQFAFENGDKLVYDVKWASNGEIFPKEKGLIFDEIMSNLYRVEMSDERKELTEYVIFVNDAPQYSSEIYANSKHGVHTNRDIVNAYIKEKLKPVQIKKKMRM